MGSYTLFLYLFDIVAFAELQTEVSDFTSDLGVIGTPIWDYKTYTFKVLFPSHSDHPVMHSAPEVRIFKVTAPSTLHCSLVMDHIIRRDIPQVVIDTQANPVKPEIFTCR